MRINLMLLILMGLSIYNIVYFWNKNKQMNKLLMLDKNASNSIVKKKNNFRYFKLLKEKLEMYFYFKKNKSADTVYAVILLMEIGVFFYFLTQHIIFLAILMPIMLHYFVISILDILTVDIHIAIKKELPFIIKHIVKSFSKTNDLKIIIYEISGHTSVHLREMFSSLSRKMSSGNYEKVLLSFADEVDDIWMFSLIFLLMSYKEQSSKDEIIKNLKSLSDIIAKENEITEKSVTDKKPIAVLNFVLSIVAVGALVGNLKLNTEASDFFFNSFAGMVCLIIGLVVIFLTVILSLKLIKNR